MIRKVSVHLLPAAVQGERFLHAKASIVKGLSASVPPPGSMDVPILRPSEAEVLGEGEEPAVWFPEPSVIPTLTSLRMTDGRCFCDP